MTFLQSLAFHLSFCGNLGSLLHHVGWIVGLEQWFGWKFADADSFVDHWVGFGFKFPCYFGVICHSLVTFRLGGIAAVIGVSLGVL